MTRPLTPRRLWWRVLVAAVALGVVATACGSANGGGDDPTALTVVATTSIWADVVANVACDGSVRVETIIPAGADPHAFEASLSDRGRIDDAVLVVANGLGLEEGLMDTIEASDTPVFTISDHVDTIAFAAGTGHHDDEDHDDDEGGEADNGHRGDDPHVWMDPERVSAMLPALAAALVNAGVDGPTAEACVADYQVELGELDEQIATMTESLSTDRRVLVTNHDALGYFADRYDFEIIGTVIPAGSTLAETNPAELEALADLIGQYEVDVIFAESQQDQRDVDALANRVGDVAVVTLYTGTLGEVGSGADTYVGMLSTNATLVVEALR